MSVSIALPGSPTPASRDGTVQSSPSCERTLFPLGAPEIPTKGSLPDFCVSSILCLESSYPLVVTKDAIESLLRNFFSGFKHSSRLKFGTVASQQRPLFFFPHLTPGKKRRKRSCWLPLLTASKLISSAPHVRQQQVNATESSNVK